MKFIDYFRQTISFVFTFCFAVSCAQGPIEQQIVHEAPAAYQGNGIEQFFLPEIPQWVNGSRSGACFRNFNVKFLNFEKLESTYNLGLQKLIELQWQYNLKTYKRLEYSPLTSLSLREENAFFLNTLEQVRGRGSDFRIPKVKQLSLLWFEEWHQDQQVEVKKKLLYALNNNEFTIIFSLCHDYLTVRKWTALMGFDSADIEVMSAEFLTPYLTTNKLLPGPVLNLSPYISSRTEILFWSRSQLLPSEIVNDVVLKSLD